MLLQIDPKEKVATRVQCRRLKEFGLDERKFQEILFRSLGRLLPDDELLIISQSKPGEDADILALDAEGTLFIFELKAWEAKSENILQVLRYGQIFGQYQYDALDKKYRQHFGVERSLIDDHREKFESQLEPSQLNQKQVFVVLTNGLDVKTREAIQYWSTRGLDVRSWIYRVYKSGEAGPLLELVPFRIRDLPYEDLSEGYFILNTNIKSGQEDHDYLLREKKAAAYFSPWKHKIERLEAGDIVFLYQSRVGVVAVGEIADGKLEVRPYQGKKEHQDEEYAKRLKNFVLLDKPIPAAEIRATTGIRYSFMGTMFGIDADGGRLLHEIAQKSGRVKSKR